MEFFRRNQLHIISPHLVLLFIVILGILCRFTYDVVGIIGGGPCGFFKRFFSWKIVRLYNFSIDFFFILTNASWRILLYTNRFATYAYIMVHNIICGHWRWEGGVLYTRCSHPRYREIGLVMQWNLAWMGRFSSWFGWCINWFLTDILYIL